MPNDPAHTHDRPIASPASGESGRPAGPSIRLEIRSNPLFLSAAREMIAAATRRLGFAEEACSQMALAVDEALCNIIRHGYNRDPARPIWISLYPQGNGWGEAGRGGGVQDPALSGETVCSGSSCSPCRAGRASDGNGGAGGAAISTHPASLRIVIEDEAIQVDPAVIKSRDLQEIRPGGLGVHIIKSVMDEVKYEHRQPKGMRLTMTKVRRDPAHIHRDGYCDSAGPPAPIVGGSAGDETGSGGTHG